MLTSMTPQGVRFGKIYRFESPKEGIDVWKLSLALREQLDKDQIGYSVTSDRQYMKGIVLTNEEKPHRYVYDTLSQAVSSRVTTAVYNGSSAPVADFFLNTSDKKLNAFVMKQFKALRAAVDVIYAANQ